MPMKSAKSNALSVSLERALAEAQRNLLTTDEKSVVATGENEQPTPVRVSATVWYELMPEVRATAYVWNLNLAIRLVTDFKKFISTLAPIEVGLSGQILEEGRADSLSIVLIYRGTRPIDKNAVADYLRGFEFVEDRPSEGIYIHAGRRVKIQYSGFPFNTLH